MSALSRPIPKRPLIIRHRDGLKELLIVFRNAMVLIQQKENLQVTFTKADTRKVKGMAIIMMVLHHSFMMPERYKGMNVIFTPFAEEQFNWICWSFKICVAVFYIPERLWHPTLSYNQENASYDLTADQTQRLILRGIIRLELNSTYIFLASQAFGLVMNPNLMAAKSGQEHQNVDLALLI